MSPSLCTGDEILARPVPLRFFRPGDLALYRRPEGSLVCHRVVSIKQLRETLWIACAGDDQPHDIEWIEAPEVLGRVEVILPQKLGNLSGWKLKSANLYYLWRRHRIKRIPVMLKKTMIEIVGLFQGTSFYRLAANTLLRSPIHYHAEIRTDGFEIYAKSGQHYAGSVDLLVEPGSKGLIANLLVRARYRGLGIGKRLLEEAERKAKSLHLKCLFLTVWGNDTVALKLYQHAGFSKTHSEIKKGSRFPGQRIQLHLQKTLLQHTDVIPFPVRSEWDFFLKLVRLFVTDDFSVMARTQTHSIDWKNLEGVIQQERFAVPFYHLVQRYADLRKCIPASFFKILESSFYSSLARQALYDQGLDDFLNTAQRSGTPFIILRGATLSQQYYPHPAMRSAADIDLLIHPCDRNRLLDIFFELHLTPQEHSGDIYSYARETPSPMNIDIHSGLWHARSEEVWAAKQDLKIFKYTVSALGREDMLLHLVSHALVHHGRFTLQDALDLALFLKKEADHLRWDILQSRMRGTCLKAFLKYALDQTAAWTGLNFSKITGTQPALTGWNLKIYGKLPSLIGGKNQLTLHYFLKALTMPSWRTRIQFYGNLMFPSADFLKKRYGLTKSWQVSLYRLIRPLMLTFHAAQWLSSKFVQQFRSETASGSPTSGLSPTERGPLRALEPEPDPVDLPKHSR